ncbi:MAG TPA: hypothetical protein VGN07_17645 [Steroidobacteraceae bacterium]|jgi:outer membrane receptor protein involved in Fe transport
MTHYTGPGVYANGFVECSTDCPVSTTQAPTIENNHIASMTTFDLSGSYKFDSFELFGTIENLTNRQPPIIDGTLTNAYWQGQGSATTTESAVSTARVCDSSSKEQAS